MTSENDRSEFDSGRTVADKLQAEVLEADGSTYFVRYPDGTPDIEPSNQLNDILFDTDEETKEILYDLLVYGVDHTVEYRESTDELFNPTTREITLRADEGGARFTIIQDGQETPVPPRLKGEALELLSEFGDEELTLGSKLSRLRKKIEQDYVDRDVISRFRDRFDGDRVRPTRNGWIVDETFIVRWDAENHYVDDPGTWTPGDQIHDDDGTQFLDLSWSHIDGPKTVETPDGESISLDEREQRFLATVEVLLHPERHLGHDRAGRVKSAREEQDAGAVEDTIDDIASGTREQGYKDNAGQYHDHTLDKHVPTDVFNVTDEVVDRLHFQQNGHAGVNELSRREQEFRNADFDVFTDTHNDDDQRWREINQRAKKALISDRTQRKLDSMFGGSV